MKQCKMKPKLLVTNLPYTECMRNSFKQALVGQIFFRITFVVHGILIKKVCPLLIVFFQTDDLQRNSEYLYSDSQSLIILLKSAYIQIQNIKIESMQIKKGVNSDEDSLFPQQNVIIEFQTHQNSCHHQKTRSSPQLIDNQSHPQDQQLLISDRNSKQLAFYQQYKKIYTASYHLALEKIRQLTIVQTLIKQIQRLEDKLKDGKDMVTKHPLDEVTDQSKAKRFRRTAEQIEKKFKCQVQFCERFYGSEGSLQQHIKLKHPELYHKSSTQDSHCKEHLNSFL